RVDSLRRALGDIQVVASLDELSTLPDLALECAGHDAAATLVPDLLARGCPAIIASVGALAAPGVAERLESAARRGCTHLVIVPGALAGIDALSAARLRGLQHVEYVGRKPPAGWLGRRGCRRPARPARGRDRFRRDRARRRPALPEECER